MGGVLGALFEDPKLTPREEFLMGLLATWVLGDKKPNKAERARLEEIARDTLRKADQMLLVAE